MQLHFFCIFKYANAPKMKQIYFFVFFLVLTIHGYAQTIQIELVDANVGASLTEPPEFYTNVSNDEGLNQIFANYNVSHYETVYGYSIESMIDKNGWVICNCDPELFIQDLLAYDTVVQYAVEIDSETQNNGNFYNGLQIVLSTATNGSYESFQNGIVVTNNSELNQIFTNFNVRTYETLYGSNTVYELVCDCNASLLKQELDNLTSVISLTDYISYAFLLSTNEFLLKSTTVYPNPFKDQIRLDTSSNLESILVYDILGKHIINTNDKTIFESRAITLKRGVYILKLTDVNGNTETRKLIKK